MTQGSDYRPYSGGSLPLPIAGENLNQTFAQWWWRGIK
jgi:hypothetical protein